MYFFVVCFLLRHICQYSEVFPTAVNILSSFSVAVFPGLNKNEKDYQQTHFADFSETAFRSKL